MKHIQFPDTRALMAFALVALFAFAYLHNPDDELTGALIGAFSGAWGYYLGSSKGAAEAATRAGKATDALATVATAKPDGE